MSATVWCNQISSLDLRTTFFFLSYTIVFIYKYRVHTLMVSNLCWAVIVSLKIFCVSRQELLLITNNDSEFRSVYITQYHFFLPIYKHYSVGNKIITLHHMGILALSITSPQIIIKKSKKKKKLHNIFTFSTFFYVRNSYVRW